MRNESLSANLKGDVCLLASYFRDRSRLAENDNDKLAFAELLGELLLFNQIGSLNENALEIELYNALKSKLINERTAVSGEPRWAHVASRFYAVGGHTRLLFGLVSGLMQKNIQQSVFMTRPTQRETLEQFTDIGVPTRVMKGGLEDRIAGLVQETQNADVVTFSIHPDDIVAATAARHLTQLGVVTLFINHSDHTFSYGPGACSAICEISALGWKQTREKRVAAAQSFMGIPFLQTLGDLSGQNDPKGPILSVGAAYKYTPNAELSFPAAVKEILRRVQNDFVVVGPTADEPCFQDALSAYPNRLHLLGPQEPDKVEKLMRSASCYLDSFPVEGGTAFAQALLMGLPVFGPGLDTGSGFSIADTLRSPSVDEMVDRLVDFLSSGKEQTEQGKVRTAVSHLYSNEAVVERLMEASFGRYLDLPADLKIGKNSQSQYVDIWRQSHLIRMPRRAWRSLSPAARLRILRDATQGDLKRLDKKIRKSAMRSAATRFT